MTKRKVQANKLRKLYAERRARAMWLKERRYAALIKVPRIVIKFRTEKIRRKICKLQGIPYRNYSFWGKSVITVSKVPKVKARPNHDAALLDCVRKKTLIVEENR